MEVIYDLDTEAQELCTELGLRMVRAGTVGAHPEFVKMVRELVLERLDPSVERRALGLRAPNHDVCPLDCCPRPERPAGRPASPPAHAARG